MARCPWQEEFCPLPKVWISNSSCGSLIGSAYVVFWSPDFTPINNGSSVGSFIDQRLSIEPNLMMKYSSVTSDPA